MNFDFFYISNFVTYYFEFLLTKTNIKVNKLIQAPLGFVQKLLVFFLRRLDITSYSHIGPSKILYDNLKFGVMAWNFYVMPWNCVTFWIWLDTQNFV